MNMALEMESVIGQIIMLFLLMGVGLFLRKRNVFTDPVIKGVNSLVIMITWPAMMIVTTQKDYTPETLHTFLTVLIVSIVMLAVACIVAYLIVRRKGKDTAPIIAMLMVMPNVGFFGIPIVDALYGAEGLTYLSAYIIGFNLVLWTVGISLFDGFNVKALKNLLNPGLICAGIGVTLFLLRIRLPEPIFNTLDNLSAMNTPLSMLILGSRADQINVSVLRDKKMWAINLVKLIAMPVVVLFALRGIGLTGMVLVILVAGAAMPSAISTQMLTERYGGDVHFTAQTTSVSTLLSLITLPLMLQLASMIA